ncbi:MAG: response regulator [Oscillospiraceae bacterium]|nr:response regulator [Oscillospiraceae bacterium]
MISVLIADDEKWMRDTLLTSIEWEQHGFYIVGEAEDGTEAFGMIELYEPDIVLTDIQMPHLDGIALLEKAKGLGLDSIFIYFSGYDKFEYAKSALNLGAMGYILKPVDEDELLEMLLKAKALIKNEKETAKETGIVDENYYNKLLLSIKTYIERNYMKDISLETTAREFSFHPNYLSKLFKEETGGNFIDYLTDVRINRAKKLLKNVRYSIADVALKVGYSDAKYFAKVFKKSIGVSPKDYIGKNR